MEHGHERLPGSGAGDLWGRPLTRARVLRLGLAGATVLTLAGCGGDDDGDAGGTTSGALERPETKPAKLVVRTWGDPWREAYADGPAASFTRKTGIPVEFDTTDYNEIQAKVRQAVRAGRRPPVDVVLTTADPAYAASAQQISVPLDPAVVTNFSKLTAGARPPAGGRGYVSPYSYTQPLLYAEDRVSLPADVSWNVLWEPRFRRKLFVTSTSPVSLLFPVAKMLGLDVATDDLTPAFQKITELRPNIGATGDEEEFIAAVERREVDVGITLVAVASEVEGVRWVVPREGATMSFESLYVAKGLPADSTYYAQVFVNEVLEAETLTTLAAALGQVPTNPASTPAESMRGDPAFPFTQADIDKYALVVDPALVARKSDEWQAAYTAAIQG